MYTAEYVGPLLHLKGEWAILMAGPDEDTVLVQFDRLDKRLERNPGDRVPLQYGWHAFSIHDWRIQT